ncbi:MAG TPA: hypothetical protein VHX38_18625 [Pseudonocardiaceae bacterium]|jgi:hypothetical protein|nr:hypothetical protein [Pseudonocardiaceae bacterium]
MSQWSEADVEHALLEGAIRDLGAVLGDEQAHRLFLTDATFNVAVTALLRTGWWPHSADIETRGKWAAEQQRVVALWDQLRRMPITVPVELLS